METGGRGTLGLLRGENRSTRLARGCEQATGLKGVLIHPNYAACLERNAWSGKRLTVGQVSGL
jgi:hypothetical protein